MCVYAGVCVYVRMYIDMSRYMYVRRSIYVYMYVFICMRKWVPVLLPALKDNRSFGPELKKSIGPNDLALKK